MHRRTFLGGSAAAALTATTASACTGASPGTDPGPGRPGPAKNPQTTPRLTHTATSTRTPTPASWAALAKSLDGPLIRPGDRAWQSAHRLYNTRFDTLKPTAVAYAAHPDDIRTALTHAREHAVPLAVRGGGHSYAGWSSGDGRLIVDVSGLAHIRVEGDTAVVGAGAKLIDV
ncbi:FAD-binding oxidoreductase, partial [Streptomyces sp. NPDC057074]|uniref:FAD-binding oxidoreductase n=1 Tax=Streptomyces sp. NPDC057074 TaxID=3346015 RepID=UPI0036340E45